MLCDYVIVGQAFAVCMMRAGGRDRGQYPSSFLREVGSLLLF